MYDSQRKPICAARYWSALRECFKLLLRISHIYVTLRKQSKQTATQRAPQEDINLTSVFVRSLTTGPRRTIIAVLRTTRGSMQRTLFLVSTGRTTDPSCVLFDGIFIYLCVYFFATLTQVQNTGTKSYAETFILPIHPPNYSYTSIY